MNFGFGGGHRVIEALWAIGSFAVGLVFFLVWVGILILLVRFLVIGTRAAKFYLSSNGQHSGLLGSNPAPTSPSAPASAPAETTTAASAEPAAPTEPSAPTVTSPTPPSAPRVSTKPRTPKTPPTPPTV